ncbi:MAG: SMI1/KNR4 family protein [Planctomycetales bacterium]
MRYANLLIKEYDRLGHNVRGSLCSGMSKRKLMAALRAFLEQPHPVNKSLLPKSLPASLVDLYQWHNGGGELAPYFHFMTFEESLESWDITSEAAEDSVMYENGNTVFDDTSPFPFLHSGGGDYVVMDVGERSPTRGSIGAFANNGCSSVRNEFSSLSKFFRAHYQCCKEGVYRVDEDGLDFDDRTETLDRFRATDLRMAKDG